MSNSDRALVQVLLLKHYKIVEADNEKQASPSFNALTIRASEGIVRSMGNRVFCRKITFFLFLGLILFVHLSCESKKDSEFRSKTNTAPVILSVAILPEKAYVGTELSLAIQSNDLDGDPITYQYQWLINDQEMPGENKSSLKGDRFKKGDLIRARVTPSDRKETGRSSLSPPVRILNSPPEIREVSIEPKRPAAMIP